MPRVPGGCCRIGRRRRRRGGGCCSSSLSPKGPQGDRSFGQAFSKACRVQRQSLWSLPAGSERPQGVIILGIAWPRSISAGPQAAVLNSCFLVRMGPIAVFLPPCQEAQTAAGVRGRAFLPKTARCAPQALEAGAFWDHQPKSLSLRSLAVLLRTVSSVFVWVWFGGLSWAVRN